MTPHRTVSLTPNPPGTSFARFLIALHKADGHVGRAAAIAATHCRSTPQVEHTLEALITRAGVGAQSISATDPYAPGTELLSLLQSNSIYGRLAPKFRRVPAR